MDEPETDTPLEVSSPITPLRSIMTEIHEIYEELLHAGFPDVAANDIVAHLVISVIHSRDEDGFDVELIEDEDEEDDTDYDDDGVG